MQTTICEINNQQGPTVYSTGNSTLYSVTTYMGKKTEIEWIHVYV